MILLFDFLIVIALSFFLIFFCNKKLLLIHNEGEAHQNFIKTKETPLIGGIILFLYMFKDFENISILYLFPFFILITGILSDSRKIKSAYFRLLLQFLIVILFVHFYEANIETTRIYLLDNLIDNYFLSVLFTTFCILIILNGVNFIDGTNLLAIGYFLILEFIFINLDIKGLNLEEILFSISFFSVLVILFFLNAFNKLYLGDGGSYLLGFIYSLKLISLYILNPNISPFFIALILWYPAFEILFSILRKLNFNRSPIKPDSNHLHQLIYFFFIKKINNSILRSNLVGIIINLFNFTIIIFSLMDIYNTQYQIMLFFINIAVYVFVYVRLLKFKLRSNF